MFVAKRWQAAALAVVVAAFEASLRRRNATIIAICVRVQQLGAPLLQQGIRLPLPDFPRRERLEGPPGGPGSRNTTQQGAFAGSLAAPPLEGRLQL